MIHDPADESLTDKSFTLDKKVDELPIPQLKEIDD